MGELLPPGTKKTNCAWVKLGLERQSRGVKEDFRFLRNKIGLPLRPVEHVRVNK
jgi:hypothetical protein